MTNIAQPWAGLFVLALMSQWVFQELLVLFQDTILAYELKIT